MTILDDVYKYYRTRNLYNALKVSPNVLPKQIRKSAYQLIMLTHPDFQPAAQRDEALRRCRLIYRIMLILTDEQKRDMYDVHGVCADDDLYTNEIQIACATLMAMCDVLVTASKGTDNVIKMFEKNYKGSVLERTDIMKAYKLGKGCLDRVYQELPLMTLADVSRVRKIIRLMIKQKDLVKFTKKSPAKRRKHNRQCTDLKSRKQNTKQQSKLNVPLNVDDSMQWIEYDDDILRLASLKPVESTDLLLQNFGGSYGNLIDNLMLKYGNDNEFDEFF